jgi:hypothetical protein
MLVQSVCLTSATDPTDRPHLLVTPLKWSICSRELGLTLTSRNIICRSQFVNRLVPDVYGKEERQSIDVVL